jgi:hypothetical protein
MICFLTTTGYDFTLKSLRNDPRAPPISTLAYRQALKEPALPEAAYVFTDIDRLSTRELIAAAALYRRLQQEGRRVLNDPARVQVRFLLLRALYRSGINPFNVYSVEEGDKPARFPVFLRLSSGHEAPLSDLLFDQDTLERAIAAAVSFGFPRHALMVVEYAAEPVRPGLFRKHSVFRLGDEFIPHVCVHDTSWLVKLGRAGVAGQDLYEEELKFMQENAFADRLKPVFAIADIDYPGSLRGPGAEPRRRPRGAHRAVAVPEAARAVQRLPQAGAAIGKIRGGHGLGSPDRQRFDRKLAKSSGARRRPDRHSRVDQRGVDRLWLCAG